MQIEYQIHFGIEFISYADMETYRKTYLITSLCDNALGRSDELSLPIYSCAYIIPLQCHSLYISRYFPNNSSGAQRRVCKLIRKCYELSAERWHGGGGLTTPSSTSHYSNKTHTRRYNRGKGELEEKISIKTTYVIKSTIIFKCFKS